MSLHWLLLLPCSLLSWPIRDGIGSRVKWTDITLEDHRISNDPLNAAISFAIVMVLVSFSSRSIRVCCGPRVRRVSLWMGVALQPLLLALSGWCDVVDSLFVNSQCTAVMLAGSVLPGGIYSLGLSSRRELRCASIWIAVPFLAITAGILVDLTRFTLATGSTFSLVRIDGSPHELIAITGAVIGSGVLASCVLPYWIVWTTRSELMEAEQRRPYEKLWDFLQLPKITMMMWPTGCNWSNAMIVGAIGKRRLLITDRMCLKFTEREIAWILMHEGGHLLGRHGLVRCLPTLGVVPMLVIAMLVLHGAQLLICLALLAAVFVILLIAVCWWTEVDADRRGVKMGSQYLSVPVKEGMREYANVLRKLCTDNRMHRSTWSHPGLAKRLRLLAMFCG